ncbi:MAG: SDR family oxidoreductase [Micromonosporaceae bacterium]|nr:SDR family oxidoreductase [Micromonosporaceae bacterium]
METQSRCAVVTGAGSGIGAGIAEALAPANRVILVGRREAALATTRDRIVAGGAHADVLPWDIGAGQNAGDLVDAVLRLTGRLDVLVHAAGNQIRRPALEFAAADWDAVLGLHLRAAFLLAQAAGRHMVAHGGGAILFLASLTSQRLGLAGGVAYATAKSGLLGLMRSLAVEWAPHGVRVNALAVGFVPTEMTRDVDDTPGRRVLVGRTPMGRLGTPAEMGDAAAFLCCDAARYITGEVLTVDGGWSAA